MPYQGRPLRAPFTGLGSLTKPREKWEINKDTEYTQKKIAKKTNNQGRGIICGRIKFIPQLRQSYVIKNWNLKG
jgi:hypothetical protein